MARQRTRQAQTQEAAGFVQSDAGVSFKGGVMYVRGAPQVPVDVQHWRSSNELTVYTTVTWRSPITGERRTSCNCNGWTNAKGGKKRACCHTKDMEGTAHCDRERVEPEPIQLRTAAEVRQHVPRITDEGERELRSIMLDD